MENDTFALALLSGAFRVLVWAIVIIWLAYIFDGPVADLIQIFAPGDTS